MFWLAIIGGSFIQLHALLLVILKLRKRNSEIQRGYGVLTFPRFEIFLVNLALPCICEASASLIRGNPESLFPSPTNESLSMHLSCKIKVSKDDYVAMKLMFHTVWMLTQFTSLCMTTIIA